MGNNVIETIKKKNAIIGVMVCVVILLIAALVYFAVIKKDNSTESTNTQDNGQVTNSDISVKKSLEVNAFNVILDTNGIAYLDLREDIIDDKNYAAITNLFNNAETYKYNGKNEKLIKLNAQNIKDIQILDFGNGGGKFIILLDNNDKLYALINYVAESGNTTLLTNEKLNKVIKVYNECSEDGCSVYADATINETTEKISLYDLFEN